MGEKGEIKESRMTDKEGQSGGKRGIRRKRMGTQTAYMGTGRGEASTD